MTEYEDMDLEEIKRLERENFYLLKRVQEVTDCWTKSAKECQQAQTRVRELEKAIRLHQHSFGRPYEEDKALYAVLDKK